MSKRKRGVTLLEIVIVMAVTAIMLTGIVSMCVSVNGISARSEQVSNVVGSISSWQTIVREWVANFDQDGVNIVAQPNADGQSPTLQAVQGDTVIGELHIDTDKNLLVAVYGDAKRVCSASTIFYVCFEICGSGDSGEKLIKCTVKYTLTQSGGQQQVTEQCFMVSTRRQTV